MTSLMEKEIMKNLSHPNFSEADKQRVFAKMKLYDDRNE